MEAALGTVLGAGWASGVNLYATVFLLGLFGRLDVAASPESLQSMPVLAVFGGLYLVELVADKIPFLDNAWDAVHTVIRPLGAAVVGALLAGETDLSTAVASVTGGGMALGSHLAKAGARLAINTSPEPASNIVVSVAEDGVVAAMIWFALTNPVAAGVVALVLLVLGVALLVVVAKVIRRGITRLRDRRTRRPSPA